MSELTTETIRQHYSYYAFVSYSRKDEKWARWLQNRLETYRLPAAIRKAHVDLPSKIAPIFRDKTDLSGTVLEDALFRELEASKYLIVICSPNSSASKYVSKEIAYFASLGREKKIIPFIIDGEPFAQDPREECFPQALRELKNELLGISVPELGRSNAFLRLVSTLLSLRYDQLVMRDNRRRRRRSAILTGTALVLAAVLGFTLWYNIPHAKYYSAYTCRNEIPEGICELSRAEWKNANACYRITTQRGKVIRLECVNSAGTPTMPAIGIATIDYPILEFTEYDRSGRLLRVDQRDVYGQLVSTKDLSHSEATHEIAIDFHVPGSGIQAYSMSADMSYSTIGSSATNNRSEITRYLNTYDDEGLLIKSMYHKDNLGTPACDSSGVYGKLYEYDSRGLTVRISNLNAQGQVDNCKHGWATVEYEYDDRGKYIRESWLDADGNPVRSERNIFCEYITYDENGNMVTWQALDEQDRPVLSTLGFAQQRWEYDDRGFMTLGAYYDHLGNPAYCADGFHEIRYAYNDKGHCIRNSYYDIEGNHMFVSAYSSATVIVEVDEAGRITHMRSFDTDGTLICDTRVGAYSMRYEYDEYGYQSAVYYLDEDGEPTKSNSGYASVHDFNNSQGQSLRTEYRDSAGDLVRSTANCAIVERSYDSIFGQWIATYYYDENGDPCYCADGYAGEEYEYENGNLVSVKYMDTAGEPIACAEGYHESYYAFENGNCVMAAYYDTAGNLVAREDGYAMITYAYDDYGNIIEKNYYDTRLQSVDAPYVYRIVNEFDSRGNKTRETGYALADHGLSFQTAIYEYDEFGNKIRQSLFDAEDKPVKGSSKYPAVTEFAYDARNNPIREEKRNADGSYLFWSDPEVVNITEYRYDDLSRKVLERYIHADNEGNETCLYQYAYSYDAYGNIHTEDYLDGNGRLQNRAAGYARIVSKYDASGNDIVTEYYDEHNNPTVDENGRFRRETDYNVYGKAVEMRMYGTDRKLLSQSKGFIACYRCAYDDWGNMTRLEVYNEFGKLYGTPGEDIAVIEYQYDAQGNQILMIGYDCEGTKLTEKEPD